MQGFFLAFLCFVAAAQARSAVVPSSTAAALGDNPWLVHLRVAVSTGGLLQTCAGALIDERWALTSATCVRDARFIWVRYGVVDVIRPSLVTETSVVVLHPDADIALVSIHRVVHSTENIAPVSVARSAEGADEAKLCVFGEDHGAPGERLSCFHVALQHHEGEIVAHSHEGHTSHFDMGAPLVAEGELVGLLTRPGGRDDDVGSFVNVADFAEWIQEQTEA